MTSQLPAPKPTFWANARNIAALSSFAIAQPLFDLIGKNGEFLVAHKLSSFDIVLMAIVVGMVVPVVWICLEGIARLSHRRCGQIVHSGIVLSLMFLILYPILKRMDFLSPPVMGFLTFVFGVLAFVAYWRVSVLRQYLGFLSPCVVVFPLIFLLLSGASELVKGNAASRDEASSNGALKDVPVVMIVFDEFTTPHLLDETGGIDSVRYPNLHALGATSHWFKKNSTTSIRTVEALPSVATGYYPLEKKKFPDAKSHPQNIFTMLAKSHEIHAFEGVTRLCPEHLNKAKPGSSWGHRMKVLFQDLSLVYLHFAFPKQVTKRLPGITQNWGNFAEQKPLSYQFSGRAAVFRRFLESIAPSARPGFHFLHILIPHPPVNFLPSGKSYGGVPTVGLQQEKWADDEWAVLSGLQRYLLQVQYADKLVGDLVSRLKEQGLFDESMIIITGDHGASYRVGQHRREPPNRYYGDILPVPLFIKVPGQRTGVVESANAEIVDVVPTLAGYLGLEKEWEFEGRALLNGSAAARDKKRIKSTGDKYREFSVGTFDRLMTESSQYMLSKVGSGKTSPDGLYKAGKYAELVGRPVGEFQVAPAKSLLKNVFGITKHSSVDLASRFLPAFVYGETERDAHVAVAVNGTIRAVRPTSLDVDGQPTFVAMLPEQSLQQGKNDIGIYLIEAPNGAERAELILHPHEIAFADPKDVRLTKDGIRISDSETWPFVGKGTFGYLDQVQFRSCDSADLFGWAAQVEQKKRVDHLMAFWDGKLVGSAKPSKVPRPSVAMSTGVKNAGFSFGVVREAFPANVADTNKERLKVFGIVEKEATAIRYGGGVQSGLDQFLDPECED